jgi:hypothetical protein
MTRKDEIQEEQKVKQILKQIKELRDFDCDCKVCKIIKNNGGLK